MRFVFLRLVSLHLSSFRSPFVNHFVPTEFTLSTTVMKRQGIQTLFVHLSLRGPEECFKQSDVVKLTCQARVI